MMVSKRSNGFVDLRVMPATYLVEHLSLGLDSLHREIRRTDLLGDTTSLTLLNIGLTNLQGHNPAM